MITASRASKQCTKRRIKRREPHFHPLAHTWTLWTPASPMYTRHVEMFWARTVPHISTILSSGTVTQWCCDATPRSPAHWTTRTGHVHCREWTFDTHACTVAAWTHVALALISGAHAWADHVLLETTQRGTLVIYTATPALAWYLTRHARPRAHACRTTLLPSIPCHAIAVAPPPPSRPIAPPKARLCLRDVIAYAAMAIFVARQMLAPESMPHVTYAGHSTKRVAFRTGSRNQVTFKYQLETSPSRSWREFCKHADVTPYALMAWHLVYSAYFSMHHNSILFHVIDALLAIADEDTHVYMDAACTLRLESASLMQTAHAQRYNPTDMPVRLTTSHGKEMSIVHASAPTWFVECRDVERAISIVDMNAFGSSCALYVAGVLEYREVLQETLERFPSYGTLTRAEFDARYGDDARRNAAYSYGAWPWVEAPDAYKRTPYAEIANSEDKRKRIVTVKSMPGAGRWTAKGTVDIKSERRSSEPWLELARSLGIQFCLSHARHPIRVDSYTVGGH